MKMTTTTTEVVPSALTKISPILRVADEIETDRPRVAYLCRFYASEKANRLDPSSSGSDVSQFKTLLLQRLERDKASSLASRVKETDTREIESFYHQYYEDNVVRAVDHGEQLQADRAQLGKPYQTAGAQSKRQRTLRKLLLRKWMQTYTLPIFDRNCRRLHTHATQPRVNFSASC